jgi:transposase
MSPSLERAVVLVRGGVPIRAAAERVGKSYHAVYMAAVERGAWVPNGPPVPRD